MRQPAGGSSYPPQAGADGRGRFLPRPVGTGPPAEEPTMSGDLLPADLFVPRGLWLIVRLPVPGDHTERLTAFHRFAGDDGFTAAFTTQERGEAFLSWLQAEGSPPLALISFGSAWELGVNLDALHQTQGHTHLVIDPEPRTDAGPRDRIPLGGALAQLHRHLFRFGPSAN